MIRFWRRWTRPDLVSAAWLKDCARRESRIEFQSVRIKFPINKFVNEHGQFQRQRCRKVA